MKPYDECPNTYFIYNSKNVVNSFTYNNQNGYRKINSLKMNLLNDR